MIRPGGKLVLRFGSDTDMRRAGYAEKGFSLYSPEQISSALQAVGFALESLQCLEQQRGAFYGLRATVKD